MAKVYFLIGGNLGDREQILDQSINLMQDKIGSLVQLSPIYETEPWGFEHEQNFLNQVVVLESDFAPLLVLDLCQDIEKKMGRVRKKNRYSERTIDIDILFYEDQIINSERLEIPHPRMKERKFALCPLKDVAEDFIHPVFQKSIAELFDECKDDSEIKKYKKGL